MSATKTLRDGETATCDCCGSDLTKRVVTSLVGNFGTDCWKAIKESAVRLKDARRIAADIAERVEAKIDADAKTAAFVRGLADAKTRHW